MNNRRLLTIVCVAAILALAVPGLAQADLQAGLPGEASAPLGTGLTYQGYLTDGSQPAEGAYDFQFDLYDADTGGILVGRVIFEDVTVTNGYFTVLLDFGEGIFNGEARWLEIGVRPGAESGAYTLLEPRQALSAAPYAVYAPQAGTATYAETSPWGGLSGMPAGFADGVDDDTLYTAGIGLYQDGTIFNVNTLVMQLRVTQTCEAGYAIRQVNEDGTVVCEQDTDTTYGVGYGMSLAGTILSVNPSEVQTRINGYCGAGYAVRQVNEDGTVTCEQDDNTTYSAGTGLSLAGTTFSVNPSVVQTRVNGVCGAGYAIRQVNEDGTVTCEQDDNTTYSAGTGLSLSGGQFAILGAYLLPQGCENGQVAQWNNTASAWVCADDSTGNDWHLGGNTITDPNTQYIGTINHAALVLRADNQPVLRLVPGETPGDPPNIIGGSSSNTVSPGVYGATISGGGSTTYWNQVTQIYGTVGGGAGNYAGGGGSATVAGGAGNTASGSVSSVGGGYQNTASGMEATIGGGESNTASSIYTTVGGGMTNAASGDYAFVGGGYYNNASGSYATLAGGRLNTANSGYATVGGGESNHANNQYATVGGGYSHDATGYASTIAGGYNNTASGMYTIATGGENNTASGTHTTVGGGQGNQATYRYDTVGGGYGNTASGDGSTVGGGNTNQAIAEQSTIAGGWYNFASNIYTAIGGGGYNTASGSYATLGGGYYNTASGLSSSVAGGEYNTASGAYATVAGGYYNTASGQGSMVAGGYANIAAGPYSFVAGRQAKNSNVSHSGVFLFADGLLFDFPSTAANQFRARATGGVEFVSAVDVSGNPTAGVALAAGGGSWSSISDRNLKANFAAVDGRAVLAAVANMPISTWNYIAQDEGIRHIGPMAQDFYAAFGVGEDDTHITTIDADGVALAAIQGLNEIVAEKDAQIAALEARLAALEAGGAAAASGLLSPATFFSALACLLAGMALLRTRRAA